MRIFQHDFASILRLKGKWINVGVIDEGHRGSGLDGTGMRRRN